jgi:hypothetical protein
VPIEQPAARQPTANVAQPRRSPRIAPLAPITPDVKPGDLVCTRCGTGNDPVRRFCRRCGNSLATAVVAQRPPWWRRLFKRQRSYAAGERPREMGRAGEPRGSILKPLLVIVLLLAVAGAAVGYVAVPNIRQRVDSAIADLRQIVMPTLEDVHPIRREGEGTTDHPAAAAADDNTLTFWLAEPSTDPPLLTVTFEEPFDLGALVFHTGSSTESDFTLHRRPRSVQLTFPGTSANPLAIDLANESIDQRHPADAPGVQVIEIRILDTYPSAGGDQLTALREIEFKARR